MTECAARLVDEVLPRVPVRQWVLSLPYRLRYLLAWDHALARAVLGVYVRALLGFQRHRARCYGIRDGRSGSVTVIQRFGGGLNLNVHFHTLLFDGVFFVDGANGALDFRPLPPPTDEQVGVALARITARVQRLLRRRGLDPSDADGVQADPVGEESAVLAGISSASIQGRIAFGLRAGARVWRVGPIPRRPGCCRRRRGTHTSRASICTPMSRRRPRIARGWNSCALSAPASGGAGPTATPRRWPHHPPAEEAWADGTRQFVFEPLELLEKLAALIPRPRINLVLYHGVLAPNSSWRARVVAYGARQAEPAVIASARPGANDGPTTAPVARHWAWADLMRRAFDIDVLACPRRGGRLRLIATVEDPDAIRASLVAAAESCVVTGRAPPAGRR